MLRKRWPGLSRALRGIVGRDQIIPLVLERWPHTAFVNGTNALSADERRNVQNNEAICVAR